MNNYPLLSIFWSMFEFFIWILWFFLLFKIITDIFRSHDMGGWAKAGWIVLVIVLPFVGVLAYVIVRGKSMGQRDLEARQRSEDAFKAYVRDAAGEPGGGAVGATASGGSGDVDQLAKLAELRTSGALSDEEFQQAKQKLLAG
ncbi:SHOCT domain-containing protein [Streptacidiphilus sp. EB129]|uniref:SHOCT domain-containing protein n=1 Tax=Streptacidiphilus sp. EB129 TaxID=3156262 RepID=UPI003519A86D